MANPYASIVILSMGNPESVIKDLSKQTFKDFEIIIASEKGIVKAMNNALNKAKGEIFVRVDDDVEIPEHWLEGLLEPFKDPLVAGATGPTFVPKDCREYRDSIRLVENPGWFLRWMFDGEPFEPAKIYKCGSVSYGSNYEEKIGFVFSWSNIDHLEGTNWAMRTDLIREVGGFDPAFDGVAEWFDTDVEQKIKKLGYVLRYRHNAWLDHLLRKGDHFSERNAMWGRIKNWLRFHRRHSRFHYKKLIWLLMMIGYGLCPSRK